MFITTPSFRKFIFEYIHIGRLIVGYSDIELALYNLIKITKNPNENILKKMIKGNTAKVRIDKAKAIGFEKFKKNKLENEFDSCINFIKHCKDIRNLYAHSNYWDANWKYLMFTEIEKLAKQKNCDDDISKAKTHPITSELLLEQLEFYDYTIKYIFWLNNEVRFRMNMLEKNVFDKPITRTFPKLKENEIDLTSV